MVCFDIEISVAIPQRANQGAMERSIQHLARHCNADIQKICQTNEAIDYKFRLCDGDGKTLLRDFPTPFNVKQITILRPETILYLHREHHEPPRSTLLKDVYWLAKSTERWKVL
jgi:hypothetical protein